MFAVALLVAAVTLNSYNIAPVNTKTVSVNTTKTTVSTTSIKKTNTENEKKEEIMRGLWVTYMEIDMSDTDRSYTSFKKKFDEVSVKKKLNEKVEKKPETKEQVNTVSAN